MKNLIIILLLVTTIAYCQVPSAPILLYPSNNATNQPIVEFFKWRKISSATKYRLDIVTDTLLGTLTYRDSTITDTTKTLPITALATNHIYYWSVKAKNGSGWGAFAGYRKLTTSDPIISQGIDATSKLRFKIGLTNNSQYIYWHIARKKYYYINLSSPFDTLWWGAAFDTSKAYTLTGKWDFKKQVTIDTLVFRWNVPNDSTGYFKLPRLALSNYGTYQVGRLGYINGGPPLYNRSTLIISSGYGNVDTLLSKYYFDRHYAPFDTSKSYTITNKWIWHPSTSGIGFATLDITNPGGAADTYYGIKSTVYNYTASGTLYGYYTTSVGSGNVASYGIKATGTTVTGTGIGGYFSGVASGAATYSLGTYGSASGGAIAYGIYGTAVSGSTNWAGYFDAGNVYIKNELDVGSSKFAVNDSGLITKVGNVSAVGNLGKGLISDGTSFSTNGVLKVQSGGTNNGGFYNDQEFIKFRSATNDFASSGYTASSFVLAPVANDSNYIPLWSGTNSKRLNNGLAYGSTAISSTIVSRNGSGDSYFSSVYGTYVHGNAIYFGAPSSAAGLGVFYNATNNFIVMLGINTISADRIIYFPNASGTLALTSNLVDTTKISYLAKNEIFTGNKRITGSFTANSVDTLIFKWSVIDTTGYLKLPRLVASGYASYQVGRFGYINSGADLYNRSTAIISSGYGNIDTLSTKYYNDRHYVLTSNFYANPSWLSSLAWSKITTTPTTLSGYGIIDAVTLGTTQTISGTKTFSQQYTYFGSSGSVPGEVVLYNDVTFPYSTRLKTSGSSGASRIITLPDATGTVALTSDLSSYVPTSRTLTINGTTYDLSVNRSWTITDISGNAGTVTNGVYTSGSYSNPTWITSLAPSKVGLDTTKISYLAKNETYTGTKRFNLDTWFDGGSIEVGNASVNGSVGIYNNTFGYKTSIISSAVTSNKTITLPNGTGTLPLLSLANTWTATNTFNYTVVANANSTITSGDQNVDVTGKNSLTLSQADAVNYTLTLTNPTADQVIYVTNTSTLSGSTYTINPGSISIGIGVMKTIKYNSTNTKWYSN